MKDYVDQNERVKRNAREIIGKMLRTKSNNICGYRIQLNNYEKQILRLHSKQDVKHILSTCKGSKLI